jgi:plasmid stability protein
MPALHVRNVPDDVYEALRARADREGRSISQETIAILRRALAARRSPDDIVEELRRLRARTRLPTGKYAPERIIRKDRDAG